DVVRVQRTMVSTSGPRWPSGHTHAASEQMQSSSVERNPLSLAPSGTASNSEPAAGERVQTHIIDRLADWSAILGALAVVLLLWAGWGFFADAATVGALGWLLALLLAVAVTASALVFRLLTSPI